MKSIRDVVHRLPASKSELEEYVLQYDSRIRDGVERDPDKGIVLDRIAGESFKKYGEYFGGLVEKLGGAGRGVGHVADGWFFGTGDLVGALGGKFIHFLAQIPEKFLKAPIYGVKTGNYLDALQNVFEGGISYLPGLTIADQGLSRIVQKRMVKDVVYRMESELGLEHESWYERVRNKIKDKYKDVRDRRENIIIPFPRAGEARKAA